MKPEDKAWHIAQAAKIREDEAEIAKAREELARHRAGDLDDDDTGDDETG